MKDGIKRFATSYVGTWWLSSVVVLIALALYIIGALTESITTWRLTSVLNVLLYAQGLCILGLIGAAVWNMAMRQWRTAIKKLLMLPLLGGIMVASLGLMMFCSMFKPEERDHFSDNLMIPDNVAIENPRDWQQPAGGGPDDVFASKLMDTLRRIGSDDASVAVGLSSLLQLEKRQPGILRRYLATSPAWRLFRQRGTIYATRRWMIGSQWHYTLNGNYTSFSIDMWHKTGIPQFQTRLTLGLSGKPWWSRATKLTTLRPGETARLNLFTGNQQDASELVIPVEDLVVEVFEESGANERRLTKASLAFLDEELGPLAAAPGWKTIQKIIPPGSITTGAQSLDLRKESEPGIYSSQIRVNPGEPGMVYLKAFEVTKGTELSVDTLREDTNEWIGWSADPNQLFLSNTLFLIYPGGGGKPYAARFELWFVPDSGKPERKLMEKLFKVEGWQR